jgi:hypothetical protein
MVGKRGCSSSYTTTTYQQLSRVDAVPSWGDECPLSKMKTCRQRQERARPNRKSVISLISEICPVLPSTRKNGASISIAEKNGIMGRGGKGKKPDLTF